MPKVYVGMSGGVDSSLSAALLTEQGYDVTGVYMKNWSQDLPGMVCPWAEDLADAKRVAVQLGIPFKVFDFEAEYKHLVVDYMIEQYQAGRTPNPDIMCNQEVKFGLFLQAALDDGADFIATGHYARIGAGSSGAPMSNAVNFDVEKVFSAFSESPGVPSKAFEKSNQKTFSTKLKRLLELGVRDTYCAELFMGK
jgi:tRNA U34 2-thiouridine synthase MnmA/TrmU